jgi:HEAT repeat protein
VAIDNLDGPGAVAPLRRHLAAEADPALRAAAVRRLGQIGGAAAVAALRDLLAQGLEPELRAVAEDALAAAAARP